MLKTLDRPDRELVEKAQEAAARAYAPYSLFAVGAAVRSKSGAIYAAANLENASSGLTICAEAAALSLANSAGDPEIDAIAVVGFNFTDGAAGASRVVVALRVVPPTHCRGRAASKRQRARNLLQWRTQQHRRLDDRRIIAERLWTREFGGEPTMAGVAGRVARVRRSG